MGLVRKIEALLFAHAEPMSVRRLGEIFKISAEEIKTALTELENSLNGRGIALIRKGEEIALGTAPDLSPLIENVEKEELKKELSRASLEVLSIVLYKNQTTRAEIDWIRGVDSSFVLRQLLMRGLVEREIHPTDARRYLYQPSFDLVRHLGLTKLEELPRFAEMKELLDKNLVSAEAAADKPTNDQ